MRTYHGTKRNNINHNVVKAILKWKLKKGVDSDHK